MAWLAGLLLAALTPMAAPAGEAEAVTLRGTVETMPELLKDQGLEVDAGPLAGQVALRADDGSVVPLLSDTASRALFLDERLRGRPVELKGRRHPGLPYVQVTSFRVEENGELRTPEYYCDVCTISVRYPQVCPCCQGAMELRMRPEEP